MNTLQSSTAQPGADLGALLRHWRGLRHKSQMDLALDSGVSQRHISFIEVGRSAPSRQMLLNIAQALDIPFRDRNSLLLAAGYAPVYSEDAWNAVEMKTVTDAIARMLRQHDPYPAVLMDRYWNVLMTNDSAPRFFGSFVDLDARGQPRNLLELMFDPDGMRPFVANWEEVAKSLIQRVHRESIGRVIDDKTQALLASLLAYPDTQSEWTSPVAMSALSVNPAIPIVPLGFIKDGKRLNYFSMITTVGTPQTVSAQELRVESMFPADEATERYHAERFTH
ncbi:helix-turn-helix domain-containing protein [Pararobbsia alpina]|uniref:helix-turn-helix domain-containing protein n=1 Tax=Pararobbsia alpina TaxID=621374 RepID=UPI0039A58F17